MHEKIYRNILKQAYNMFRLFVGTFVSLFPENNYNLIPTLLIEKLEYFYSKVKISLKIENRF